MSDETYEKLRLFLDEINPSGCPEAADGSHKEWLMSVYDEDEARTVIHLGLVGKSIETIVESMKKPAVQIVEVLERMFEKGTCQKDNAGGETVYAAMPINPGWLDTMFITRADDKDFMDKTWRYVTGTYAGAIFGQKLASNRTLPVDTYIDSQSFVEPCESLTEIIKNGRHPIAAIECACRARGRDEGNPCVVPVQTCMAFGHHAQFYLDRGLGKEIDEKEALNILKQTDELGCVHRVTNVKEFHDIAYLCNCCKCHCAGLIPAATLFPEGEILGIAPSNFMPEVDRESCEACEVCVEKCPVDALHMKDDVADVDRTRCIGCGVCVGACQYEAIRLIRRPETKTVDYPKDLESLAKASFEERKIMGKL